jgi:polyisoprenyl-teichoic acid--peptidoglycan teichoic acid transferase
MATKFNSIAAASREVVATDIPTSEIGTMIDLALKAKALPVSSVAMMPPLIDPSSPDFDKVRRTLQKKIEASEAIDTQVAEPTLARASSGTPKPKPTASLSPTAQTDDLGKVCSA